MYSYEGVQASYQGFKLLTSPLHYVAMQIWFNSAVYLSNLCSFK